LHQCTFLLSSPKNIRWIIHHGIYYSALYKHGVKRQIIQLMNVVSNGRCINIPLRQWNLGTQRTDVNVLCCCIGFDKMVFHRSVYDSPQGALDIVIFVLLHHFAPVYLPALKPKKYQMDYTSWDLLERT